MPGSASGVAGEAEAVGADDDAVLQDDVVAEPAVLADDGVGVGEEVAADVGVGIDDDVRQQRGVLAEDDVVADDSVCADVGAGADLRGGCDDGGGMDSGRVRGRLVEQFQGVGEGEVGVGDAEGGGGDLFERRLDQDGSGLRGAGERGVFGVGDEGELAGPASSRPAAEVISASGSPWRVAPRCAARVESFMGRIVEEQLSVVSYSVVSENKACAQLSLDWHWTRDSSAYATEN